MKISPFFCLASLIVATIGVAIAGPLEKRQAPPAEGVGQQQGMQENSTKNPNLPGLPFYHNKLGKTHQTCSFTANTIKFFC
jgi:hypothetical protein